MFRQQAIDNQMNHLDRLNNYQPTNPTTTNTGSQVCCLIDEGTRCHRLSGNACCSKPIQRKMMIQRTKLRLSIDETARHIYICDHHKNIIQTMRSINKRKKKDDDDDSIDEYSFNNMNYDLDDLPVVDLSGLQVNTLRRYKRHFRVSTKPGINKSQLVECIENHFHSIPVVEREILTYFIYMVKTNKNKLDQKNSNQL